MTNDTELREQIIDSLARVVAACYSLEQTKPKVEAAIDETIDELAALFVTQRNNLLAELRERMPSAGGRLADEYGGFTDCLDQVTALIKSKMEEK